MTRDRAGERDGWGRDHASVSGTRVSIEGLGLQTRHRPAPIGVKRVTTSRSCQRRTLTRVGLERHQAHGASGFSGRSVLAERGDGAVVDGEDFERGRLLAGHPGGPTPHARQQRRGMTSAARSCTVPIRAMASRSSISAIVHRATGSPHQYDQNGETRPPAQGAAGSPGAHVRAIVVARVNAELSAAAGSVVLGSPLAQRLRLVWWRLAAAARRSATADMEDDDDALHHAAVPVYLGAVSFRILAGLGHITETRVGRAELAHRDSGRPSRRGSRRPRFERPCRNQRSRDTYRHEHTES